MEASHCHVETSHCHVETTSTNYRRINRVERYPIFPCGIDSFPYGNESFLHGNKSFGCRFEAATIRFELLTIHFRPSTRGLVLETCGIARFRYCSASYPCILAPDPSFLKPAPCNSGIEKTVLEVWVAFSCRPIFWPRFDCHELALSKIPHGRYNGQPSAS